MTSDASGNVPLKHDVESGAVEEHRLEHGAAGEAAFVPVSLSAGEDEGYVMAFAHHPDGCNTDLVILAAQVFAGEPVARSQLPVRVPLGDPWQPWQLDRGRLEALLRRWNRLRSSASGQDAASSWRPDSGAVGNAEHVG